VRSATTGDDSATNRISTACRQQQTATRRLRQALTWIPNRDRGSSPVGGQALNLRSTANPSAPSFLTRHPSRPALKRLQRRSAATGWSTLGHNSKREAILYGFYDDATHIGGGRIPELGGSHTLPRALRCARGRGHLNIALVMRRTRADVASGASRTLRIISQRYVRVTAPPACKPLFGGAANRASLRPPSQPQAMQSPWRSLEQRPRIPGRLALSIALAQRGPSRRPSVMQA
jgi:hypothetical protein